MLFVRCYQRILGLNVLQTAAFSSMCVVHPGDSLNVPKTASGRKSYWETGFAGKNQSNLGNMNANSLEFRYRCSYRFDE